jgi:dihydroorotate dehydrogenase
LTSFTSKHQIDGVILNQTNFREHEQTQLRFLRKNTDLIVVSRGGHLIANDVLERVTAGAHHVQVYDNVFRGGPYALFDLKE